MAQGAPGKMAGKAARNVGTQMGRAWSAEAPMAMHVLCAACCVRRLAYLSVASSLLHGRSTSSCSQGGATD